MKVRFQVVCLLAVLGLFFQVVPSSKVGLAVFNTVSPLEIVTNIKEIHIYESLKLKMGPGFNAIKVVLAAHKRALIAVGHIDGIFNLMYPYKSLALSDYSKTYFLTEGTVMEVAADEQVIMGPLCPCIGFVVTCVGKETCLVGHICYEVAPENVIKTIQEFAGKADIEKIELYGTFHKRGFQEHFEGVDMKKWQEAMIAAIEQGFSAHKNKIKKCMFDGAIIGNDLVLCPYKGCQKIVVIADKGTLSMTSLITEIVKEKTIKGFMDADAQVGAFAQKIREFIDTCIDAQPALSDALIDVTHCKERIVLAGLFGIQKLSPAQSKVE